ncbi:MAG: nickel-binding protein [Dehalococcoidia bacterium]
MPMYLDRHEIGGASAADVAAAHARDVEVQDRYGVKYVTYWFDYDAGRAFCLVDSPDKETAAAVHREAHGLIASEIIDVDPQMVQAFLGKIVGPSKGEPWAETAFRTILFTDMEGSTPMTQHLGDAGAMGIIRTHDAIVRDSLAALEGHEVKHTGDGIMASFASVSRGVECAIAIQRKIAAHNVERSDAQMRLRIGLSAGEPVTEHDDLFGAAVQLARRICDHADADCILVSNVVRELCIGKNFLFSDIGEVVPKGFDEAVRLFEVRWQD